MAQDVTPSFRHFTSEDGLSGSELYCVIQDCHGNLWFGGDRGVVRYDGYEFRTFTTKDGLSDNTVFDIYEDVKGRIWMYTFSGRLFYLEKGKIQPFAYNAYLKQCTGSKIPLNVYVDSLDNVFVSIRDTGEVRIARNGSHDWIYTRDVKSDNRFYSDEIVKGRFLTSYSSPESRFTEQSFLLRKDGLIDTLSFAYHKGDRMSLVRISDTECLFSVGNTLYSTVGNRSQLLTQLPELILSVSKDRLGNVFVGTYKGCYMFSDHHFEKPAAHFLKNDIVSDFIQDNEGGYWFVTLENGVFYSPGYAVQNIVSEGLLSRPMCLTTHHSQVYVGYWSGALARLSELQPEFLYFPTDTSNLPIVNLSSFENDSRIYFSRYRPGFWENGKMQEFKTKAIVGIKAVYMQTTDGRVYSSGSAYLMKVKGDSLFYINAPDKRVNCVVETPKGELLLGTNTGVFLFDENTKRLDLYREEFKDLRVENMERMGDKIIMATKGRGVLIVDEEKSIVISEAEGLSGNLVDHLLISGKDIWCTTSNGISRITIDENSSFKYRVENVHSSDGLLSETVNDIALNSDTLFVATNKGISFFNINHDFKNEVAPLVYIASVDVNNHQYSLSTTPTLTHSQNAIRVSFTGISFRSHGDLLYKYELVNGSDTVSASTTNREVQFLSLSPGSYSFSVLARNKSGVWSKASAGFSFVIRPAWYQTLIFRIILSALVVLVIYIFYLRKLRKVEERYELERKQASLQLTAIRAQMNPHFIFNVMNSIRNYMQNHDLKSAEKYLVSFSKLVRYTLDNSDMQIVTLEEELASLKNYVELEMQQFEDGFDFSVKVDDEIDLSDYELPSMLLQPFVENAIKHGISRISCRGKICISVKLKSGKLLISIEDNGVGVESSIAWNDSNRTGHKSKGTTIIFERIEAFNKAYSKNIRARIVNLTTEEGRTSGTRVEVEL